MVVELCGMDGNVFVGIWKDNINKGFYMLLSIVKDQNQQLIDLPIKYCLCIQMLIYLTVFLCAIELHCPKNYYNT